MALPTPLYPVLSSPPLPVLHLFPVLDRLRWLSTPRRSLLPRPGDDVRKVDHVTGAPEPRGSPPQRLAEKPPLSPPPHPPSSNTVNQ
ncbi:MAG: hypothetical protein ACK55Z_27040 [bacterium]